MKKEILLEIMKHEEEITSVEAKRWSEIRHRLHQREAAAEVLPELPSGPLADDQGTSKN